MIRIAATVMDELRAHAEAGFPEESWGWVLESPAGQVVRRMTNVQNALHARDPESHPRDARMAWAPDPRELRDVEAEADQPGWRPAILYHSHPEHGAYFSQTDRTRALWDGSVEMGPIYPDVVYVVLSVYGGAVREVKAYGWDDDARDFLATPIEVSAAGRRA
jgi:[CysO sulfur-carrier protein]-S-L-cysteine hydrolase